jgi:peptidoglycan/LPS O-acetylase OafA/YrhL
LSAVRGSDIVAGMGEKRRYEVLDSWRGVAACFVVLFHFHAYSHIYDVPLIRNSFLFVDFFFVLSGFVIAANYQDKLLQGFGIVRFMALRFGRLYPLHIFVLLVYIAARSIQSYFPELASLAQQPAFTTPKESLDTIIANVLLLHSFHLYDFLTWNGPSWSIATEFYTYLLFALTLIALRHRTTFACALLLVALPIVLALISPKNIDTTYDFGLIRCIYGFVAGVVCFQIFRRLKNWRPSSTTEFAAVLLMGLFVSVAGTTVLSLAAPYVFGVAVLIFAYESGAISRILLVRPFLFIGALSYSIYMTHNFLMGRLYDLGKIVRKVTGNETFTRLVADGNERAFLGTERWHGDLYYVVLLVVVVLASYLTFRYIESPARNWFRKVTLREPKPGSEIFQAR